MIAFDPYSEEFLDDPYRVYARLREEQPIYRHEESGAYFLSRFDDIWAATQTRKLSVAGGITPSQLLLGADANPMMPSQMDPPRHTAMRSLLSVPFRPHAIAEWEHEIRDLAKSLLVKAVGEGSLDVAQDYGARISCHMACRLVGFPMQRARELPTRINGFFHRRSGHRGETEKAAEAAAELYEWVGDFIEECRADPSAASGITSGLLEARVEDRLLTGEELVHIVVNLLIAASDTFPKALSGTLDRLAREPDQRAKVATDPELIPGAFLEALRIDTPTQFQGRTVLEPIEFHGVTVEAGDRLCFLFPAANRDPREFALPEVFDVHRNAPRTLAFGNGIHLCLGKRLAMLEARVALEEFFAAIPEYEVRRSDARFARTEYVRGWLNLPIEFAAR